MAKFTSEDLFIRNIENGIRGLKLGTKTLETCNVAENLNRLRGVNAGLYTDYLNQYTHAANDYKRKNKVS